jgi:hypothetical protein
VRLKTREEEERNGVGISNNFSRGEMAFLER